MVITQPLLPIPLPAPTRRPHPRPQHELEVKITRARREAGDLRDKADQNIREAETIEEDVIPDLERQLYASLLAEDYPRRVLTAILERFALCWAEVDQLTSALRGEPFHDRYVRWIVQRHHALLCDLRLA